MYLVEISQSLTVAFANFFAAAARTGMMSAVTVLNKEDNDSQCRAFVGQFKSIHIMLNDAYRTVFCLTKGVRTIFLVVAVSEEVRNEKTVYKS